MLAFSRLIVTVYFHTSFVSSLPSMAVVLFENIFGEFLHSWKTEISSDCIDFSLTSWIYPTFSINSLHFGSFWILSALILRFQNTIQQRIITNLSKRNFMPPSSHCKSRISYGRIGSTNSTMNFCTFINPF